MATDNEQLSHMSEQLEQGFDLTCRTVKFHFFSNYIDWSTRRLQLNTKCWWYLLMTCGAIILGQRTSLLQICCLMVCLQLGGYYLNTSHCLCPRLLSFRCLSTSCRAWTPYCRQPCYLLLLPVSLIGSRLRVKQPDSRRTWQEVEDMIW